MSCASVAAPHSAETETEDIRSPLTHVGACRVSSWLPVMHRGLRLLPLTILAACSSPPPPTVHVPPPLVVPVESQAPRPVEASDPDPKREEREEKESVSERALRDWSRSSRCPDFDYFPNGGIQNFWCHRPADITMAAVRQLAGVDIFSSGPHKEDLLLTATNDFGHYHPAFVRWLVDRAGPSPRGSVAQRATQKAYDAHLKPLAEIFWATLGKALQNRECFEREKSAYAGLITQKKLPKDYYERWFYFMNPYFCEKPKKSEDFMMKNGFDAGVDGNVTKTVVGFWLRRSIDGTMDTFAEGLKKVMASYQPELLEEPAPAVLAPMKP